MDALVLWRSSMLQKRASGDTLRPVSPPPPLSETAVTDLQSQEQQLIDEQVAIEDHKSHGRSKSEPPTEFERRQAEEDDKEAAIDSKGDNQGQGAVKKPTSSSWVQWWNRSRRTEVLVSGSAQVLDPVRFLIPKLHGLFKLLPPSLRYIIRHLHPSRCSNSLWTRSRRLHLQA
jgi:phosphatidate phosphatase LPIN